MPGALCAVVALCLCQASIAQSDKKSAAPSEKPAYGVMHLKTGIGSFKMLEYNDDKPPEGKLEMTFTGTVLVDTSEAVKHPRGLTTKITTVGDVRNEMNFHGRKVYFGKGKIIVEGGWHALQWFGQDMEATFNGSAVFRLNGEFDKNLETGSYWFDGDPKRMDWGTGGNQPTCPPLKFVVDKPKIQINGKPVGKGQ